MGGGSAEVVSIGIGGARRPDYARIVCGQVAAARRELGMDIGEFTRLVNELTPWGAMPEQVAAWENDIVPPADVVAAVTTAAGMTPGAWLLPPFLADRPPAFPVEALAGPWVTSYRFSHDASARYHADIAHVIPLPDGRIRVVNHPPEPRSEGRARSFRNEIEAALSGRHLVGQWRNTSDTRYYGALELAVLPGETVMHGHYTGVASDIDVSTGYWKWVRLDADSIAGADLAGLALRHPEDLYDRVMSHSQTDAPLTLADVTEEP